MLKALQDGEGDIDNAGCQSSRTASRRQVLRLGGGSRRHTGLGSMLVASPSCQVILGTQYAGEMKKGVFSLMNYVLPKMGILSLHSGCNEGKDGDVTLFFGLSGE